MSFDRDRGIFIRNHPTGFRVGMYADSPGRYYDERGAEVTEAVAKAAGFDVAAGAVARKRELMLKQAMERVERQFRSAEERLMVLAENQGHGVKIKEVGAGKYGLFDADDVLVTVGQPLTWEEAVITFEGITGKKYVTEAREPANLSDPIDPPPPSASASAAGKSGNKGKKGGSKGDPAFQDDNPNPVPELAPIPGA